MTSMNYQPKQPIQSVNRAIDILRYIKINAGSTGVGLNALCQHFSLSKSSVFRILDTLLAQGMVEKNEDGTLYKLSWGLYELASAVPFQHQISRELYASDFERLSVKYNNTLNVGMLNGNRFVVIDKFEAPQRKVSTVQIGGTMDLFCTGIGKVFLSGFTEEQLVQYFEEASLQKHTPATITTLDDMRIEIEKIHKQGYAVDDGEYIEGLKCIAFPFYSHDGTICAAASVSGLSQYIDADIENAITADILAVCHRVSEQMGYNK